MQILSSAVVKQYTYLAGAAPLVGKDAIANYMADQIGAQVPSDFAGPRTSHRDRLRAGGQPVITPPKMITGFGVSTKWAAGSLKLTSFIIRNLS
jgi:hypothetical protein